MLYQFNAFWLGRVAVDRLLPPQVRLAGFSLDRRHVRSVSVICTLSGELLFVTELKLSGRGRTESFVRITGARDIERFFLENQIGTDYLEGLGQMSVLETGKLYSVRPYPFEEENSYLAESNVKTLVRRHLGKSRRVHMNSQARLTPEEAFSD